MNKTLAVWMWALMQCTGAFAQVFSSMTAKPVLYALVSTTMPESVLNGIALDAASSGGGVILVLRGFPTSVGQKFSGSFAQSQQWIAQVNKNCCAHHPKGYPSWIVDPKLFEKFDVKSAPTFAIEHPSLGSGPNSYAKISGQDISVGNALKAISSSSQTPLLRKAAQQIYQQTFSNF